MQNPKDILKTFFQAFSDEHYDMRSNNIARIQDFSLHHVPYKKQIMKHVKCPITCRAIDRKSAQDLWAVKYCIICENIILFCHNMTLKFRVTGLYCQNIIS